MMLNRKHIRLSKMKSENKNEPAEMTKSEALSFLWELTQEVYSLSGRYDVKSRLQRHAVSITRQQD